MINIGDFDFNMVHLLKFDNDNSQAETPLIAIETITKNLYMNLDYLMIKYYGKDGEMYLKLILMFNNHNDVSSINVGDTLRIPSLPHLLSVLSVMDENAISMNGINAFSSTNLVENNEDKKAFQSKDKRKTTANPRLNITLEKPQLVGNLLSY